MSSIVHCILIQAFYFSNKSKALVSFVPGGWGVQIWVGEVRGWDGLNVAPVMDNKGIGIICKGDETAKE